jgi:hypothetical protein
MWFPVIGLIIGAIVGFAVGFVISLLIFAKWDNWRPGGGE